MKEKLLFILASMLIGSVGASAQVRFTESLDSVATYISDENGREVLANYSIYQRNEAGQIENVVNYDAYGTPRTRVAYKYEDTNNDGILDEVQDCYEWQNNNWILNNRYVTLKFNNQGEMEEQEWYLNTDTGAWAISSATHTSISADGLTVEVVDSWEDYDTKQLLPFQKQYVELRSSIYPVIKSNPEMHVNMIIHHMADYSLRIRYSFNSETNEWMVDDYHSQGFDEEGVIRESERMYYSGGELYAGDKTTYAKIEDGYRYENYSYYDGDWHHSGYSLEIEKGNMIKVNRYDFYGEDNPVLYYYQEQILGENGKVVESTTYFVTNGVVGNPDTRYTYEYDEQGHLILTKTFEYHNENWMYSGFDAYEYDNAGRMINSKNAYSYNGPDNGWNGGTQDDSRYSADGKLLMRATYYLDVETSTADNLEWRLGEKICYFYHHDNAVAVKADAVVVAPDDDSAEFTWPIVENASMYNLYVYRHAVLYRHYMFDAQGCLLSIRYAPGKDGVERGPRYAAETENGWKFTIQDLESGVEYEYTFTAEDENGAELQTITGSFETQDLSGIKNIEMGQDGIRYDMQGRKVSEGYKGIVIIGGKKRLVK